MRTLHLSPQLVTVLREHKTRQEDLAILVGEGWRGEGYVFSSDNGRATQPENVKRALKPMCERANVPLIRIHDMRHTNISLMAAKGVPINVISKNAGHARTSITLDLYRHVFAHENEQYVYSMEDLLKPSTPSKTLH